MTCEKLTPAEIGHLRSILLPMLATAEPFADGELTAGDMLDWGENGFAQVWIAGKDSKIFGVWVTDLVSYPRIKALRIIGLAGKFFNEWKHFEALLEQFAREQGCTRVEAYTRPGMARKMEKMGYKMSRQLVTKYVMGATH